MEYHEPVLLNEVLKYLNVKNGKKYVDCTLGDGGHTIEILKRGGFVLGLDYDMQSLQRTQKRIDALGLSNSFIGIAGNFKDIDRIAAQHSIENVDGILYDLGYSSFQLENKDKGLSFLKEAPLDMRFDRNLNVTASDLINTLSAKQLEYLFREFGEEKLARRFGEAIVHYRGMKKIESTTELAEILVGATSSGYDRGRLHPATRVFQALRIVVNDEIENLRKSLPRALHLLKLPGGRMVIVSFHSLEDRLVKEFGQSVRPTSDFCLIPLNKRPIRPSEEEVLRNKRSRSAKMRVYEANLCNDKRTDSKIKYQM